jgi:hypothetical protein
MTDDPGAPADTFGVSIGVDDDTLRFLVHVPSTLAAAWDDRDAFQRLVESTVWDRLDRKRTLGVVDRVADSGERVELGTVTLTPDGAVVDHDLSVPAE